MDALDPSFVKPQALSDSSETVTTKQCIQGQLAAVLQLFEHNTDYLQPFERSWIEHIISEAASASQSSWNSEDQILSQSISPSATMNSLCENLTIDKSELNPRSSLQTITEDDIKALLGISKNLNSAKNLLLCCYDRWPWLKSSQVKRISQQNEVGDLHDLPDRQKQPQRISSTIGPQVSESIQQPQCHDTTSSSSFRVVTMSIDGSETSLSLTVDDTVDKWRQSAEYALDEATARSEPKNVLSHQTSSRPSPLQVYTYQPYRRESASVLISPGPLTGTTDGTEDKAVQRLSISSRSSSKFVDPIGTAAMKAASDHSMQDSTSPQRFVGHPALRPAFLSRLQDSFDKEVVDVIPRKVKRATSNFASGDTLMCSSCLRFGCRCESTTTTPVTTLVGRPSTGAQIGHFTSKSLDAMAIYALPSNISTTSVHSRFQDERHNPISRGRRWLEQQSDSDLVMT